MVRILYWNIPGFSLLTILGGPPWAATLRRNYILSNLTLNTPDIFVVVGVVTGGGPIGSPITGIGAVGALQLLAFIRANVLGNWFLVPPLISGVDGAAEGIAVYYNDNTVHFTGPNVLRATPPPPGAPPGAPHNVISVTPPVLAMAGAGAAIYPMPWLFPGAGPFSALPAGNNFAGKVRFHTPAPPSAVPGVTGQPIMFPNLNGRSPFLTTFTEVAGAPPGRQITLIAFRSSPGVPGTAGMLQMEELITPPIGNEVQVIVGSFNVPLGVPAPNEYGTFGQVGFTQRITIPAPPPGNPATQMFAVLAATPAGVYSHYGYMNPAHSFDNIFTRYGTTGATAVPTPAGGPIAGANAALAAIPLIPPVLVGAILGGGITVTIAVAAALEAAAAAPNVAAAVLMQLALMPALAGLMVPTAVVQAAANAINAVGAPVPGAVIAALGGGLVPFPVAAAAANAAALALAGAEVFDITQAVSLALLGIPPVLAGAAAGAAAGVTLAALAAANAVHAAAVGANIPVGPPTTAAAAQVLLRAAASTGPAGVAAAVPVTALVAAAAAVPAFPANTMIVNRVTGAPYVAPGPPPPIVYPTRLMHPLLLGMAGPMATAAFQNWNNYGPIGNTSQHIALVINV
ncbi:MAG TPA: hypothetical protein VGD69_21160 [Herpetosiphonaceae bacterium]